MENQQDPDKPLDIGFVGDVQSINPSVIKVLQNDQFIPVISPIAYNDEDDCLTISMPILLPAALLKQ
ncbi:Acetylglutamate kinase [Oligella ureolytica]